MTFYDEKRLLSDNDPPIPDGGGRRASRKPVGVR